MIRKTAQQLSKAGSIGLAGAMLLALVACASTPQPPTQQLQAAESAINTAEQQGVADFASADLNQAREKLTAARNAVEEEDMVVAQRLADESRVSAELATAKAEMLRAEEVNEDLQRTIDSLEQEMLRNTGNRQ